MSWQILCKLNGNLYSSFRFFENIIRMIVFSLLRFVFFLHFTSFLFLYLPEAKLNANAMITVTIQTEWNRTKRGKMEKKTKSILNVTKVCTISCCVCMELKWNEFLFLFLTLTHFFYLLSVRWKRTCVFFGHCKWRKEDVFQALKQQTWMPTAKHAFTFQKLINIFLLFAWTKTGFFFIMCCQC